MQIDHPEWLFGVLCSMKKPLTFGEFEDLIVRISHQLRGNNAKPSKGIEKGSKSVEMNLYMLSTLKLVESNGEKGALHYTRTSLGDQLCELRKLSSTSPNYRRYLRSVLMRNSVIGPMFRDFMALVNKRFKRGRPLSTHEMKELFSGETDRTLLSLGKDAGLITVVRGFVRPCEAEEGNLEDMVTFHTALQRSYSALSEARTAGLQPRSIYVEIAKIRDVMLSLFGLTGDDTKVKFDQMLTTLLESPRGRNIHLHGAAPQYLPEKSDPEFEDRVFRYKDKIYVFMSIA